MNMYRVRGKPFEGEEIIMELFEAQSDAEQFYKDLQSDSDDNILNAMPYDALVISMEEFVNGTWTLKSKKVVLK